MTTFEIDRQLTVGMIGLGIMGSSFVSNLLSRGYSVHVYNRIREKSRPLVEKGAIFHSAPRELASVADIIMTSLTDENAVDSVTFGKDGLLSGAKKGVLWIDLSTIEPSASIKHSEAATGRVRQTGYACSGKQGPGFKRRTYHSGWRRPRSF